LASEYPPLQVFGLGPAVHDLAVAQAELGHEVHVVTNSIGGRDPDAVVEGVHVRRVRMLARRALRLLAREDHRRRGASK